MTTQYPVFIICRDRLEPLLRLLAWLETAGHRRIVLLDNDSAYAPLLDFYRSTRHDVIRLGANFGHRAPWTTGLVRAIARDGPFVVTDPDVVPVEDCPLDALDHFRRLLDLHADVTKVGFGLKIDDLPDHYQHKTNAVRWEKRFWKDEVSPGVFRAKIDTTFALYRPGAGWNMDSALRTGSPYLARHLSWYEDSSRPTIETQFYRSRAYPGVSTWTNGTLPAWLAGATAEAPAEDPA